VLCRGRFGSGSFRRNLPHWRVCDGEGSKTPNLAVPHHATKRQRWARGRSTSHVERRSVPAGGRSADGPKPPMEHFPRLNWFDSRGWPAVGDRQKCAESRPCSGHRRRRLGQHRGHAGLDLGHRPLVGEALADALEIGPQVWIAVDRNAAKPRVVVIFPAACRSRVPWNQNSTPRAHGITMGRRLGRPAEQSVGAWSWQTAAFLLKLG
jgi:hypothetical protein